jgi:HlyD family secretion protein
LFTGKYKAAFLEYNQNLMEQKFRFKQKKSMFERNKLLFDKGVIAASVFENSKTEFDLSQSYLSSTRNQTYNTWQVELVNYNDALKEFQTNENKLLENKSQFFVTAPISGTLFNTAQLRQGSFVSQGSKLAEISPSTDLIVECYINPKDIGLIDPNNKVIFQIDAYNYNQWGLANGDVIDIGKDIVIIDQQPIFRVRCKLNENHLALKNGVKGDIKKGMTVRARFLLIEQSLFDLLYNDIDDWLNPASA